MRRHFFVLTCVAALLLGMLVLPAAPAWATVDRTAQTHRHASSPVLEPGRVQHPTFELPDLYRGLLEWVLRLLPKPPAPESPASRRPEAAPTINPLGCVPGGH